ncbi:MAG: PKD domain-containing protein, partial [Planctomycetes bacterium]|nr:PKD domain-containing protein [Planctomycetota bacterium]
MKIELFGQPRTDGEKRHPSPATRHALAAVTPRQGLFLRHVKKHLTLFSQKQYIVISFKTLQKGEIALNTIRQPCISSKKKEKSENLFARPCSSFSFVWLIVSLVFVLCPSVLLAQLANSPWPMFMHDIQHTGQSPLNGPQENTLYLQYKTGSEIMASPVLGTDSTIYVGDISGKFYAISPEGATKWTYSTGGEIYATAAIDAGGAIYIGSEDGYLYAFRNNGSLKWKYKTLGGISSSAVIKPQDGSIYFGSEDKNIYALNTSGKLVWKSELDEEICASPVLDTSNDVLYIGTLGGTIYAINAADGTEKWTYGIDDIIVGSPAIDEKNGTIIIGFGNGEIRALKKTDGSLKWKYTVKDAISSTPAIDTATNANAVYAGSEDGSLYSLNRTTGLLNWKYATGDAITSSPAIDKNGNIYFGSSDKKIYSVNKNGALQWTYKTQDEVNSSPAIGSNGLLYIGSSDGYLYAIGAKSTAPLTADFTATPTNGETPLTVQFTDQSVGNISSWLWDFGDGSTSSAQNPTHTYTSSGNFTVSLTVTGLGGSDTEIKENYISVTRKASTIELNIPLPKITFGESITVTGLISPAHQALVTLTFTNDEGETETETATSDSNGIFTLTDYFPPEGGSWSVVASWEGDSDHSGVESDPLTFEVSRAAVGFTIEPISVEAGKTVNITGIVTLTPDNETTRNKFLEKTLKLISINPDEEYEDVIETQPFLLNDQIQYKFEAVKSPDTGAWKFSVGFEEDNSFPASSSGTIEIEFKDVPEETVAGYAILVEGRVKGKTALDSHNLTTNDIYKKLLTRGFTEENIYYFNFDDSQDGVDETPSKDSILDTIETWGSEKMNESPVPLYIIFVGFGDKEKFFLYPDTLEASDLADALNSLESQLNSSAAEKSIVIIFGANRSGSFIKALSKSGSKRVIITSADTEEVAYKGPLPPDETIRHADYFVWEFFKYAAMGLSLRKCYEKAVEKVAEFTENEDGNGLEGANAGNGQYFDDSAQHPLLDDNGDGVGTYGALSSRGSKDGIISSLLVLGIGKATTPLELTEVTGVTTLEAEDSDPTLFAKVNDTARVDEAWTEIVSPNFSLKNDKEATAQQVINLPRFSYDEFDSAEKKYIWNDFKGNKDFNDFNKTGEYEIFYFARDNFGGITPFMESDVFKNAADNQPPESFYTISPANGTETAVALTFDWEDSADPDSKTALPDNGTNAKTASKNEGVTYTLMISQSSSFDTIQYQQKGLTDSITVVDKTAELMDGITYYWKVLASDAKGGTTLTGTSSSFKPKLANGYPGFIKGFIFDNETNTKISGATITVQGVKGSYTTTTSGAYFLQLSSGTYNLSVDASGYKTGSQTVSVNSLNTTTQNIGLTVAPKTASISGTVKDKKKSSPMEGVTITLKKKKVTKTATT